MTGRRVVDLSHPIRDDMPAGPWTPRPRVIEYISRGSPSEWAPAGSRFVMEQVILAGSTGTFLAAPFRFHPEGPDVAGVPLERLFDVPIAVVRATGTRAIGPEAFAGRDDLAGAAVLVHTGHARHWDTDAYFMSAPHLTAAAVEHLLAVRPRVVGIDSQNIDDGTDPAKPAQHRLLGAGIALLERMTGLDRVPERGALLRVLPTPVAGVGAFPVRPVAIVGAA
ncbi:cyclase family protein [Bailinhaonella thermotolerans]|uniref:Cyclase family protein n=1 Tax=Bailinhaonella thermotolerans TaxID=1070861 RepID=A0A3A4BKL8_9ACTN|nr:cyclase family protein [Bailinhaonella thermotolerans]RJL35884.1 cyclase family protein [Bailinhaonella thermotolerans]